jgi:hypothetical protein
MPIKLRVLNPVQNDRVVHFCSEEAFLSLRGAFVFLSLMAMGFTLLGRELGM